MKPDNFLKKDIDDNILILLRERELYGREIIKGLFQVSNGKLTLSFPTLYGVLRKLESRGLLETQWGDKIPEECRGDVRECNRRRHRRKYYKISLKGSKVLVHV